MHGQRIPAQTRDEQNRCLPLATDGLAPEPDCLTMYASFYETVVYRPPFADFRVNFGDGTTGIFSCQRGAAPRSGAHLTQRSPKDRL